MTLLRAPYGLRPVPLAAGSLAEVFRRRRRFINEVAGIVGLSNVRAFYLPAPNEGLAVPDAVVAGRVWTHGATPTGRLTPRGKATVLSFNGTSDYLSTPDAADLSFGTGAADAAFSVFSVQNITDTAAARQILSKYNTVDTEYRFGPFSTDAQLFAVYDNSVPANCFVLSNAALTQGAWSSLGGSYDGRGSGAGTGMAIYENGAVVASTVTNNSGGTYVAMEDKAGVLEIGSHTAHTAAFFSGSIALVLLVAGNLSAAQHAQLHQRCRVEGLVA